jgi:hypothetical protein
VYDALVPFGGYWIPLWTVMKRVESNMMNSRITGM